MRKSSTNLSHSSWSPVILIFKWNSPFLYLIDNKIECLCTETPLKHNRINIYAYWLIIISGYMQWLFHNTSSLSIHFFWCMFFIIYIYCTRAFSISQQIGKNIFDFFVNSKEDNRHSFSNTANTVSEVLNTGLNTAERKKREEQISLFLSKNAYFIWFY